MRVHITIMVIVILLCIHIYIYVCVHCYIYILQEMLPPQLPKHIAHMCKPCFHCNLDPDIKYLAKNR